MSDMIDTMKFAFKAAAGDRKGVTALEYGVIAAAIIAVCIVAFKLLGTTLNSMLEKLAGEIAK